MYVDGSKIVGILHSSRDKEISTECLLVLDYHAKEERYSKGLSWRTILKLALWLIKNLKDDDIEENNFAISDAVFFVRLHA